MRILAIDPATHCGWAFWNGTAMTSGVWDLSVKRDESIGFRLVRLKMCLKSFGEVDSLFFEAAGFTRFKAAAQIAGQIEGVFLTWAEESQVLYKSVKPTELKKWATGKGNVSKSAMIKAARDRTGYAGDSHDEADARLVLAWAVELHTFLSNEEQEIFVAALARPDPADANTFSFAARKETKS